MKEQNYWQQFLNTGKIEDYLSFKDANEKRAVSVRDSDSESGNAIMGDNPYAGICEVNRNGFKDGAYRGIR